MKNHIMLKSLGIFVNKFVNKTILVDGIYCSVYSFNQIISGYTFI